MEDLRAVSENLRQSKNVILRDWEEKIRHKLRAARNEEHIVLRNSVPEFIDDLSLGLEIGLMKVCKHIIHFAHKHGSERAHQTSYSIEDALTEYKILREVLFQHLEKDGPLDPRARDLILEGIHVGMAKAAAEYTKLQKERSEETNNLLETVLNQMPAGVSISAVPSGEVLRRNQKSGELFPVPYEVYRMNGAPIMPRDYPTNRTMRTGEQVSEQLMIKRPDNTISHVRIRSAPILDPNGNMFAVATIADDISHIKEKELELKEALKRQMTTLETLRISEKRYGSLFQNMTEEVHVWKIVYNDKNEITDWKLVDANPATLATWKRNLDEIKGKTPDEIFGDGATKRFLPVIKKVANEEGPQTIETYMEKLKKHYRFMNFIVDDLLYTISTDITEVKNIENVLRESETRYRQLANSMPQLAWTTDPLGKGTFVNARFTEFTGETIDQIKEELGLHLIHPDDREKVKHEWTRALTEGSEMESEMRLRSKTGEYHWFLVRAVPLIDDEGNITKWFGTNTDISEQKATLDELHEETILRDKFVSTLSHDLRTPLTAARMSAELIRRRKNGDERSLSLSTRIIENLDRANVMIEDLLDASKVRAGKEIIPDIKQVDVVDITQRTLEDLSTIHGDRFVMSSPKTLEAWIDPNGFRRILENLCTNAIKYGSPDDPVTIRLTPSNEDIYLSVHNQGHPLLNVDKQRLFDPFHRGEGTGGKKGWGIGLTIVRGITEAHRGEVNIETSSKGTTFTIRLPLDARKAREEFQQHH